MIKHDIFIQSEGFFPSEGRWLFYKRYSSPKNKKGEILALHGAAEHSGRYHELGSILAQNGYHFYILDFTGHGRSEGRRGHVHHFEDYLVDIANFYAFLKIHKKMEVPYILGHSMGGLLATIFTAWGQCPAKGLILSGPLFKLKVPVPFFKRVLAKLLSSIYPAFCMPSELDPALLTHDTEIVEEYLTDPLVQHHANVRWFTEMLKAMKKAQFSFPCIKIPCLFFHGEKDSITDPESTKASFQKLASQDKELYIVREAYHEVFNEQGREQVFEKLIEWLDVHANQA